MKLYNFYIKYRLAIGILFLVSAIVVNWLTGFWPSFILYLIAVVSIFGHFFFGPLRLIQEYMEAGDLEGAEKILNSIQFPNLLYKPIRSVYYTLKGNLAMTRQDYDTAEKLMKKGIDLGSGSSIMAGAEGTSLLQMGMLALQKNNFKQAESYIRQALRKGLPDKENEAAAFLQMSSIMIQKREFRAAKDYFRKAKALKPSTPQIADQIKQMEKYISRMPG
ncbi:MAG: tetratricopeptide repeat protein [Lacibacter sp.]